jgi:GNAT superfamily N-acetyltransferase
VTQLPSEVFFPVLSLRYAQAGDISLLKTMIHEFAAFERLPVVVTEADLLRDGFEERPKFRALLAEWDAQPAGYALFFDYYSTFHGRPGIFLEDVYVRAPFRGKGIGKALFARAAAIARQEDCFGLRWQVLDWNTPAIAFYQKLGATFLDEWRTLDLESEALQRLASSTLI